MKSAITLLLLTFSLASFSQHQVHEYRASNDIIYKVGDTVMLGMGSAPDGSFRYLTLGGWSSAMGNSSNTGKGYALSAVVIKKIKTWTERGANKAIFTVAGGNITNYNLQIEEAILTCEIKDCKH